MVDKQSTALDDCANFAKFQACKNGLLVGVGKGLPKDWTLTHAPFALFPQDFPKKHFEQGLKIMTVLNSLMDRVSQDEIFLLDTLRTAAQYDDFTKKLIDLYVESQHRRIQSKTEDQEIVVGLFRSDYMFDQLLDQILQIEFNTISVSFFGLSKIVSQVQKTVISQYPQLFEQYTQQNKVLNQVDSTTQQSKSQTPTQFPNSNSSQSQHTQQFDLPKNESLDLAIETVSKAKQVYEQQYKKNNTVLLLVTDDLENNAFDQELISEGALVDHSVPYIRVSLQSLYDQKRYQFDEGTGDLRVDQKLVSVVFFRSAYTPTQLGNDVQWEIRKIIEFSNAAKCPNMAYQLAGTKKVQQQLAKKGVLEQFVDNEQDISSIKSVFTDLYSLEDQESAETQQVIQEAIQLPENYVVKPQREGGGNNLYNNELKEFLIKGQNLGAYILMHKIKPPIKQSFLMRRGEVIKADVLSEFGVYGSYIRQGKKQILNKQQGYLLRTKVASSDEGGVAAGYAVLDSVNLV